MKALIRAPFLRAFRVIPDPQKQFTRAESFAGSMIDTKSANTLIIPSTAGSHAEEAEEQRKAGISQAVLCFLCFLWCVRRSLTSLVN